MNKNTFSIKEVLFLLLITCMVAIAMGYIIAINSNKKEKNIIEDTNLNEFIKNYEYILENYYEDIDKDKLITGAVDGMVQSLGDNHSTTISNENYFNIQMKGTYEGIGVHIVTDTSGNIVVYGVIEDSPAEKAGIKPFDIIKLIDGQEFDNSTDISNFIKENEKELYVLTILRGDETLDITVTRDKITIKSILSEIKEKDGHKIGYIYVSIFAENTAEQFVNAVNELEQKEIESLIIDVRGNNGGKLTTVVDMLSCLLNKDKKIYQIQIKDKITEYYSYGNETKTYPIVVLQDRNSASASELLSAALKESYNATIIGETSYGKGTVQELVKLSNGKEYKFTTKKWLTPNGNWINEIGVKPDIEVSLDEIYFTNPSDENDNQLQSALLNLIN